MLTTTQCYLTYQGNGAATSFPFGFYVPDASYLVVTIYNSNTKATTTLTPSQYSVSGIGNASGGTVTYGTSGGALPSGSSITIQRVVPYQQNTNLANQGAFYPQVVESAMDFLCMQIQQIAAALGLVAGEVPGAPSSGPPTAGLILVSLSITGSVSVAGGASAPYSAIAKWSDGSTSAVPASWTVTPTTYGTISAGGVLNTLSVNTNETVTVGASYSHGGVSETASYSVTITPMGGTQTMSQMTFLSTYGNLASAVTGIGGANTTLFMDQPNTVSSNLTVPANINLVYMTEGVTTVATGVTLVIQGLAAAIALTNQMFNCQGTGAVVFGNPQYFICPQHFGADDTGANDCTAAMQACVNAYNIITMSNGNFLISGQITMPQGVHILGRSSQSTIQANSSGVVSFHGGTILHFNNTSASPFVYTSGNVFQGLTCHYPNQSNTAASPTVYPATFTPNTGVANITDVTWEDIQLVNPYVGIDARCAHQRLRFINICGSPIAYGLRIDGGTGIDVLDDISFSPWFWCQSGDAAATWMASNGVGIDLGRSDDFQSRFIMVRGYNFGMQCRVGSVNGAYGPSGSISNLYLIGNTNGLYCTKTGPYGLSITNLYGDSNVNYDVETNGALADVTLNITGGIMTGTPLMHFWHTGGTLTMANVNTSAGSINAVATGNSAGVMSLIMHGCTLAGSAPLNASGASLANLILCGNNFANAPGFAATPATNYRYSGNINLSDH